MVTVPAWLLTARILLILARRHWARLRYLRRLAWYRVTFGRRMPRYKGRPGDGPFSLSVRERAVFCVLGWLASQRGVWADEPDYEKRS